LWFTALIHSLAHLGRFAEATDDEATAIRLAEPTHHALSIGLVYFGAVPLHLLKGEWAKAHSLVEHHIDTARRGNVVLQLPLAITSSAWALAQLGKVTAAVTRLREGEELLESHAARGTLHHTWGYYSLGRASLVLDRLDESRRLGSRVLESSSVPPGFAAYALHLLGDVSAQPSRFEPESAEAYYRKALALAEPRGMRPLVAHCHLGLGTLHGRAGKRDDSQEHLATAVQMYREMDMQFWLEQAGREQKP
jgi:tetratricopeptide (TPR) repeat protein